MKKRFISTSKEKNNFRMYFYMIIFTLSFISTMKLIISDDSNKKEYLLSSLINEGTSSSSVFLDKIGEKISSPKYIIYNGLNKIVEKNNLSVFSSINNDNYDYSNPNSEYVVDPEPSTPKDPIVYIYNTHQLEEYSSITPYDYSVNPNVMIASYIMREKLEKNGISSVVETNNVKEYLDQNNMSYNNSYHATEYFARTMQNKYPSIKYLIDIHRDSVSYDKTYTEIDGKGYARILLVTGLEHTTAENNIGFAEKLDEIIKEKYPGLSRGVLKKTGAPIYGVYNQNLNGKSVLIELGGVDNKIEEVYNTIEALSECLKEYIEGDEWKRKKETLF